MSLLRRTIVINSLVITGAFLVLLFSPIPLTFPPNPLEMVVLGIVLVVLLAVTSWGIRRSLMPLASLSADIRRVRKLDESHRLRVVAAPEVQAVAEAYNDLVDRISTEQKLRTRVSLDAQEAERRRIARELHDEIGQTLTFSLIGLANVVADHPEWESELEQPRESVRAALEQVRKVAGALRPGVLEDLGLRAALEDLLNRVEHEAGLRVERDFKGVDGLTEDQELVVFRVCQEALTNVVRHARATTAWVSFFRTSDEIVLRVVDDGIGFRGEGGSGIEGMEERALLVDGTLGVRDRNEGGTEVTLTIPARLPHAAHADRPLEGTR
ncbi:sensor histidine kinase [Granulicoccus sp. GXG6511]|uniref:sensor histidine kinase n=1 Tax=Granulicoccus sp. GXG6511 TaxID=3381351 RepID=UPI003D7D3800